MNQEIPDGWNKVKFKELAKQKSVRIDNPGESGFEKYVGLEHLDSGELVVKRYGSTSDVTSAMKLFNKGDVLFARRNTYLKRVSVAPFDGVCSGDIIVLEPILEHIVEGFLPIFMQFEPFENKIIALSAGAFSKRIKWKQLAEEDIVIPSIEEQKKIVEIILSIEVNAEKNESLIKYTEVLKKGLLNELLTKGIGHHEFKEEIYCEKSVQMPINWRIVDLQEICHLITDGKHGDCNNQINSGYYFISVKDIFEDDIHYENARQITEQDFLETHKRTRFEPKDIVLTNSGTIGKIAIAKDNDLTRRTTFQKSVAIIKPKHELVLSEFLAYSFMKINNSLTFISNGSAQKNLLLRDLRRTKIIIPDSYDEQKEIVDVLSKMDISKNCFKVYSDYLFELKKKLTNDYLSGKLIIPAEVL